MDGKKLLTLLMLGVFASTLAWSQIGNPPPSRIDQMNRERDALKRRTDALASLQLSYTSSGHLTSSLVKTNPQSLVIRVWVNGHHAKEIAKSEKPKVATGIEPGQIKVEARWTRPGTRLRVECAAELEVGFQEVLINPYGGRDNFSCAVIPRALSIEVVEEWETTLSAEEHRTVMDCVASEEPGNGGFWTCVDRARIALPWG